jgi:uncharacterized protein (DUF885 family)
MGAVRRIRHATLRAAGGQLLTLQLRLLALRQEVEAALGPRFEQKKFHDFILSQGLLPPELLRKAALEDFVPSQK